MNKEQMKAIAEAMATKMAIVKFTKDNEEWKDNIRKNPLFSEVKGMEQMLKMMGIDFEYEFDENIIPTAIIIGGERAEIA